MRSVGQYPRAGLKLLIVGVISVVLITLRYLLRTPQRLESLLPGESRLYKWRRGYVFYKVLGPVDAPPIVLLHGPGIGASSYEMRGIMGELAQHHQVYALDLPGFGLSDRPALDYTADTYLQLYQDFLVTIVARPAILLASGLSCNYCVALADKIPDLCERLILLSPTDLLVNKRQQPEWLALIGGLPLVDLVLYALLTTRVALRAIIAQQYGLSYTQVSARDLDYISATAHQFGAQRAALAYLSGRLVPDVSRPSVTQPTLIIWGGEAMPQRKLLVGDSTQTQVALLHTVGRQIQQEQPEAVVARILEWLPQREEASVQPGSGGAVISQEQTALNTESLPADQEEEQVVEQHIAESLPEAKKMDAQSGIGEAPSDTVEAYCARCKQKRVVEHVRKVVTKNGRNAMEGNCTICGTKIFRFISAQKES